MLSGPPKQPADPDDIEISDCVNKQARSLLYDPQTAGGVLISIPEGRAEQMLARLLENYPRAAIIGAIRERGAHSIKVI